MGGGRDKENTNICCMQENRMQLSPCNKLYICRHIHTDETLYMRRTENAICTVCKCVPTGTTVLNSWDRSVTYEYFTYV